MLCDITAQPTMTDKAGYMLCDITARDKYSQVFPLRICIMEVIKYWRQQRSNSQQDYPVVEVEHNYVPIIIL